MYVVKLLEYEDNNKKYIVYIKDSKLSFGYVNDMHIYENLSLDELKDITAIYNLLVGESKDLIKLSKTNINNSLITFFYNPKNHLYSFYEEKYDKLVKPDNEIVKKLNIIFNNHEGKLYQDKEIEDKEYIKIFVKKGAKVFSVLVLSSLLLSYLPAMPNNQLLFDLDYAIDNSYKDANIVYDNENYSFDSIKDVIDNNPSLSEDEKKFLYNIKPEIEENIEYIDINQLKTNLANLSIVYNEEHFAEETNTKEVWVNYNVSGTYTYMGINKYRIDLYYDNFYHATSLADANKSTLIHEINHVINNRSPLLSVPGIQGNIIGTTYTAFDVEANVLNEMVNELFAKEYGIYYEKELDFDGYSNLMPVMYALAEIIDEDTLRRYKFNSDDYYINNYFKSIDVSSNYVYSLYKDLNLIRYGSLNDEEKEKVAYEIYDIIKYMYEKKYTNKMEDDLVMQAYFYKTIYTTEEQNKYFEQLVGIEDIFIIKTKGYFAKEYIKENTNVILQEYVDTDSDEYLKDSFIITEENRFVNKKVK